MKTLFSLNILITGFAIATAEDLPALARHWSANRGVNGKKSKSGGKHKL